MKKILFLNYEYPPLGGGAANATKRLLKEYSLCPDMEVDLVTSAIGKRKEIKKLEGNITIYRLPIGKKESALDFQTQKDLLMYSWKAYFFARNLAKQKKYDLTHSFFTVPCGFLSLLLKLEFKLPYIVSLRGSDVPGYNERFNFIYIFIRPLARLIWKNASFSVSNSTDLTALAQKSSLAQKFLEIPNGVDTDYYTPGKRTATDKQKTFVILCAARLTRRKGFSYAISAFSQIADKYPWAKMVIAGGEGNAMRELQKQACDLKLEERIVFTGHYTKREAPEIYRKADVFLMPSLNEGMSNNLLEAMAAGLPVLMTPTGGAKKLVRENKNGFIIAMKDVESIVEKLSFLIENPADCLRLGDESRKIATTLSWLEVAKKYRHLYNQI